MRFLCVSDQIDPLVYATNNTDRYGDVDAVLCAGDLSMEYVDFIVTTLGKPTFFVFGNHDLEEFDFYKHGGASSPFEATLNKHHGGDYASNKMYRCKNLTFDLPNGKKTPLLICGVSGSMRYNNGKDQYTNTEMLLQLIALIPSLLWNKLRWGRYCDIFLTHASPRHIHDREDPCHKGFKCFNWFIKKFEPAMLIHGHIHLYDLQAVRKTVVGKTTVMNAYSHIIVDFNPNFTGKGNYVESNIDLITDR